MAQTITKIEEPGLGKIHKMKMAVINVANGANETSVTVDWATYGINEVLIAGHIIQDAYTTGSQLDAFTAGATSVVHTWTATDVANVRCWVIGR